MFGFAVVFAITPILRKALLLLRPLPAGDCNAWHCRQARVEYLQWLSQHEWGSCRQSATSVASSPYCKPQQKPQLALFLQTRRKGRVSEPVRKQKEGREKVVAVEGGTAGVLQIECSRHFVEGIRLQPPRAA